jgi:hypothetical protein
MLGSKAEAVESEGIYMTKAEFDFDEFDFDEFDAPVSARSCQGERENLLEGHKLSAAAYTLKRMATRKIRFLSHQLPTILRASPLPSRRRPHHPSSLDMATQANLQAAKAAAAEASSILPSHPKVTWFSHLPVPSSSATPISVEDLHRLVITNEEVQQVEAGVIVVDVRRNDIEEVRLWRAASLAFHDLFLACSCGR